MRGEAKPIEPPDAFPSMGKAYAKRQIEEAMSKLRIATELGKHWRQQIVNAYDVLAELLDVSNEE